MSTPRDGQSVPTSELQVPLRDLARLAQQAVGGADGAGVTVLDGATNVMGTSNLFASSVDHVQYGGGEGPCLEAVATGRTVLSGSIGSGEHRWPHFTRDVKALGVRSALSLPLQVDGAVVGSLNLYARRPEAFNAVSVAAAEAFVHPAATSISAARLLIEVLDAAVATTTGLTGRAEVETAVGFIVATQHLSVEQARAELVEVALVSDLGLAASARAMLEVAGRLP